MTLVPPAGSRHGATMAEACAASPAGRQEYRAARLPAGYKHKDPAQWGSGQQSARAGGVWQPGAHPEPDPGCPTWPQHRPHSGQQEDIRHEAQQRSSIYDASETGGFEPDQRLFEMNIDI